MAESTGISWADSTFNPWIGCTKVSPACDSCYAERLQRRVGGPDWGTGQPRRRTTDLYWRSPVHWNRRGYSEHTCGWRGEWPKVNGLLQLNPQRCPGCSYVGYLTPARRRVFCASLADVFDNEVDPSWRADLFALILATPRLDWLLLTKRIGNAWPMIAQALGALVGRAHSGSLPTWPWPNAWLGSTIVNQPERDRDLGKLLETPAAVHFVSVEPMLGAMDLRLGGASLPDYEPPRPLSTLDWVICGGESGPGARPMDPAWVRSLRDQCEAEQVPFLFKQWGEWAPWNTPGRPPVGPARPYRAMQFQRPDGTHETVERMGVKAAGCMLDGREHHAFPPSRGTAA